MDTEPGHPLGVATVCTVALVFFLVVFVTVASVIMQVVYNRAVNDKGEMAEVSNH